MTRDTLLDFNDEQINLIRSQIAPKATPDELALFIYQAKRTGLDPLTRQIYCIHRNIKEGDKWIQKMTVQTSIDGFRLIAERTGEYEGQIPTQWADINGKWHDVWLKKEPPYAARVGVYRKGFREALVAVAKLDSYKQEKEGKMSGLWVKMPEVMIAKVAEALAFRKAFPQDLSGIYTTEEMQQADQDLLIANDKPKNQNQKLADAANNDEIEVIYDWLISKIDECETLGELEHLKLDKDFKKSSSSLKRKSEDKYKLLADYGLSATKRLAKLNEDQEEIDDQIDYSRVGNNQQQNE